MPSPSKPFDTFYTHLYTDGTRYSVVPQISNTRQNAIAWFTDDVQDFGQPCSLLFAATHGLRRQATCGCEETNERALSTVFPIIRSATKPWVLSVWPSSWVHLSAGEHYINIESVFWRPLLSGRSAARSLWVYKDPAPRRSPSRPSRPEAESGGVLWGSYDDKGSTPAATYYRLAQYMRTTCQPSFAT